MKESHQQQSEGIPLRGEEAFKESVNWSEVGVSLAVVALLSVLLAFYRWKMALLGILGLLLIWQVARVFAKRRHEAFVSYVEGMGEDLSQATKHAIFHMPFPLVLCDDEGNISWYNTSFSDLFEDQNLLHVNLQRLLGRPLALEEGQEEVALEGKVYRLYKNLLDTSKTTSGIDKTLMMYWVDITDETQLEEAYRLSQPVVALVEVDNFDEAMDTVETGREPMVQGALDSTITEFFLSAGALARKVSDDTYLAVMSCATFEQLRQRRFAVLDAVRQIEAGNAIPLSLSIGISSPGLGLKEAYEEADTCLDVALGRGGDQAVVRVEDTYEFFGGKSKAAEKRNKVKARVLGGALRQLIDKSSEVFVLPHKNADMDAIGAAVGVLRAVENRHREGYLVLNASNPSIDNLIERMKAEEPQMYERVITGAEAMERLSATSLAILVDNHKPSFAEHPPLVEAARSIVVIDHHRRGTEFVNNPVLTYVEPYASSTCELVTEMLSYMDDDLHLTDFEADALMSGIAVDTKNFSFHTGVRTFEAASTLRRNGADMGRVKALFEDDYDTILARAEVVKNTKIYFDDIAISTLDKDAKNSILVAAQAADELLDIHGIRASFVLTRRPGAIHISGRSLGDISVQLILEKIGGGGHLNMAGAQIATDSLEEAQEKLLEAISQYLEEGAQP